MNGRTRGGAPPRLARAAALAATFGLAAAIALALAACSPAKPRVDVVLFMIDTLRADRTGPYGRWPSPTPFLDELAAESVVFEQAYAPAPWTLPSTVSLLTSQPLCEHGVSLDGQTVAPELATLAERMADTGRRTGSFFANPFAGSFSGLDRGFEVSRPTSATDGELVAEWLDAIGSQSFFLYAHNIEPHDPYSGAPTVPRPRQAQASRLLDRHRELTRADWLAAQPLGTTRNEAEQQVVRGELATLRDAIGALYDADVRRGDALLGSVLAELRRRGRLDRTVFLVVSDHGEEFGEHGGWQHDQALYEELVRVPMLIRLPGGEHGGLRIAEPVSLIDVAPTLAELLDEPRLGEGSAGVSLVPLIQGRTDFALDARAVSTRWNHKKSYSMPEAARGNLNVAVREGSWKAIWNAEPDTLELYDLARDPRELRDRSAEEPERAARLAARAREHAAPCLAAEPERVAAPVLDDATRERLRELGYLDE